VLQYVGVIARMEGVAVTQHKGIYLDNGLKNGKSAAILSPGFKNEPF
jgi:hypothetical protein